MARKGTRKLKAAWGLTILATAMLFAPTLSSSIATALGVSFSWVLIGETTWATIISLVWTAYFSASVAEKHSSFMQDAEYNKKLESEWKSTEDVNENLF